MGNPDEFELSRSTETLETVYREMNKHIKPKKRDL